MNRIRSFENVSGAIVMYSRQIHKANKTSKNYLGLLVSQVLEFRSLPKWIPIAGSYKHIEAYVF